MPDKPPSDGDADRALTHNSTLADQEPAWGDVDKTTLPRVAFADRGEAGKKSTWSYPHHWVKGGQVGADGVYESGTLYLHKGGLNAAWAAAQGAHTGEKASAEVIAHLQAHRHALGLDQEAKTLPAGRLVRTAAIELRAVNAGARTVDLSFSSEAPVRRWFGDEVLSHDPTAVRLDRLNAGAPLLLNHDDDEQIGVVEHAAIGPDRKGRAVVRFGRSARAEEVFQDVRDGIRRNVSVGYQIHQMEKVKEEEGLATYQVNDWEPLEITLASIPADQTVGVGRQQVGLPPTLVQTIIKKEDAPMPTVEQPTMEEIREEASKAERARIAEIFTLGERHKCVPLAQQYAREGKSVEAFRAAVLEQVYQAIPIDTPDPTIGLTDQEARTFSFIRAINALGAKDWKGAEFERDCSRAVAAKLRKEPQGCFIPYDVLRRPLGDGSAGVDAERLSRLLTPMGQRALLKGTGSAGGYTVATILLASEFIELLRNRMMVLQMGARVLGGLVGDIAIPSQTGAATTYWVAENVAVTGSQQTFGQLAMVPHTVGAFTDISRKLLMQASIDVEAFVRMDLAKILALAIDVAAINGSGSSGQPLGILNTSGIGSEAGGTNGAKPTWTNIVNLETDIAAANADVGQMGYLTNAKVRGILKQTAKIGTTYPIFIWDDAGPNDPGMGMMNGYRSGVSNQVPSNLTKGTSSGICSAIVFGNWDDLILAEWGALDLLVDPYTGGAAGTLRVRVLQDVDVGIRHVASFAAMADALTS